MRKFLVLGAALFTFCLPETSLAQAQSTLVRQLTDGGRLLQAGAYRIGNRRMRCGSAKTLISPKFWDYGGALPDLIILNPRKMKTLPRRLRMFVYEHECAHQNTSSETRADCTAIKKGKREGWLRRRDVQHVCQRLFLHSKGDRYHPAGPKRCKLLLQCYDGRGSTVTARARTHKNIK